MDITPLGRAVFLTGSAVLHRGVIEHYRNGIDQQSTEHKFQCMRCPPQSKRIVHRFCKDRYKFDKGHTVLIACGSQSAKPNNDHGKDCPHGEVSLKATGLSDQKSLPRLWGMKNASQVGTQKVGDTAAPCWALPAPPYCQRAPYSALWGCHPLVCRTSTGLAQSRPDQFANWSARGRLRKQAPSLDGDRAGGVPSPQGNDTPVSLLYLYNR